MVRPEGDVYEIKTESGITSCDSSAQSNLAFEIFDESGNMLGVADGSPRGAAELLRDIVLPADNEYFIRITGEHPAAQLYQLEVNITEDPSTTEFVVETHDDSVGGALSLREAVRRSHTLAGQATTIVLGAGTYAVDLGSLDISGALTIRGTGAGNTVIESNGTDRVFDVSETGWLTLHNLTVTGGDAGEDGIGGRRHCRNHWRHGLWKLRQGRGRRSQPRYVHRHIKPIGKQRCGLGRRRLSELSNRLA